MIPTTPIQSPHRSPPYAVTGSAAGCWSAWWFCQSGLLHHNVLEQSQNGFAVHRPVGDMVSRLRKERSGFFEEGCRDVCCVVVLSIATARAQSLANLTERRAVGCLKKGAEMFAAWQWCQSGVLQRNVWRPVREQSQNRKMPRMENLKPERNTRRRTLQNAGIIVLYVTEV